jgi:hypothetical protein
MNRQAADMPQSLQRMIADAGQQVERWVDVSDDNVDDTVVAATRDWAVRLSRGEYDEDLYWECVAEDCERAGDFSDGGCATVRRLHLLEHLHCRRFQLDVSLLEEVSNLVRRSRTEFDEGRNEMFRH